jgi:hypothetical protein
MTTTYKFVPRSTGGAFTVTFDDDLCPTAIDARFLSAEAKRRILGAASLHPLAWWRDGFGKFFEIRKTATRRQ